MIERIQRWVCRYAYHIRYRQYPVRKFLSELLLLEFPLKSLSTRMTLTSLAFLFELVHGQMASGLLYDICIHVSNLNCRNLITKYGGTSHLYNLPLNSSNRTYNAIFSLVDIFQYIGKVKLFTKNCATATREHL